MSENKKWFYLKFKENYFEKDQVRVVEAMKNGYEYSLIILKLYLKSLRFDGQLKINDAIPYNKDKIELLASVLGHDPANVMHSINLAKELGIMDVFSTGEMFMLDIQEFIGHSSTEAERKRIYREKLKKIENTSKNRNGTMSLENKTVSIKNKKKLDKRPPEIELETELEKEKEIYKKNKASPKIKHGDKVKLTEEEYKKLEVSYGIDTLKNKIQAMNDYLVSHGKTYKNYYRALLTWLRKDQEKLTAKDDMAKYYK